jgi:hypothetical protein
MDPPNLMKFTIDENGASPTALLDDAELDILDVSDQGHVSAECEQEALTLATFEGFPRGLSLSVRSSDGFGTFLFHLAEITRDADDRLIVEHICHEPNKYWEGTWGLAKFLDAISKQLPFFPELMLGEIELADDWKRLSIRVPVQVEGVASDALRKSGAFLKSIIREAEIALGGITWKPEYAKDEGAFCEEILGPLLRRMGFLSVRYTHGTREYGKDFTFSEPTPFGVLRHYGLQAKAGDVSGEVNSSVDELVGQADDAFKMPYIDVTSVEPRYISTFVIAISGRYTSNAKEKIVHKIAHGLHGSIVFLDREAILELIGRYWKAG